MRMPEMPIEPAACMAHTVRRYEDEPEDEDRIHELLAWVHRRVDNG